MATGKFYIDRAIDVTTGGHKLSHELESFRSYGWEIEIPTLPGVLGKLPGTENERLTLACKQVTQIGFSVEDVEVHRVNERFYYPGKPQPEEITVTFDNLIKGDVARHLFAWMRTVYDPVYGVHYAGVMGGDIVNDPITDAPIFKKAVTLWQLDAHRNPRTHVVLYGCYPKGWKLGEFNYSTNDFHTIEMTLKYDFAVQFTDNDGFIPAELSPVAV